MPNDIVWIKTFADADAAQCVGEQLRARGIPFQIGPTSGKTLGLVPPTVPGIRVGVHADDVRAALEIVWERER